MEANRTVLKLTPIRMGWELPVGGRQEPAHIPMSQSHTGCNLEANRTFLKLTPIWELKKGAIFHTNGVRAASRRSSGTCAHSLEGGQS